MSSRALLVALCLIVAACSNPTAPSDRHTFGTYTLAKVNGVGIPFLVVDDEMGRVDLVGGSIELNQDLTFRDELIYAVTPRGGVASTDSQSVTGSFSLRDGLLQFVPHPSGVIREVSLVPGGGLRRDLGWLRLVYVHH